MDIALLRWTLNLIALAVAVLGCLLCGDDVFTRIALVSGVVAARVVFWEVDDTTPRPVTQVVTEHSIEDPLSNVSP